MHDILIHVRGFETHTPAARFGVRLASRLHAAVTAVFACPDPVYVAPAYQPEALMVAITENRRQLVRDAVQAKQTFVDWANAGGVTRAEWLVAQGPANDALAQAATWHDLVVLDHGDVERDAPSDISRLVLRVGIPCLVVPPHEPQSASFARAAVAWNGSPEALRAIHSALPFLRDKPVLLMHGKASDRYRGVDWQPPFNVCEYLRRRGVMVDMLEIEAKPEDAGAALLERAANFRADLLVMGAYGRSRFSEWMLGGATRHVLTFADLPVLMQH
ncbi:MAG TPA: universal stress protein [Rhodanobacteraceae bacterium]|nr:universal stress protein [Rhodanobacteraceae bacterium]